CGAADPAEPFVHPNETLCKNGLCRSLDREALRPWKTVHKGTCQIQFAHHRLFWAPIMSWCIHAIWRISSQHHLLEVPCGHEQHHNTRYEQDGRVQPKVREAGPTQDD